jgi:hypothetical protein
MTVRPTPLMATWFLMQFGSNTENESVIGDLFEQYQRDRGRVWYWRQVLSIVFVRLYREFQRDKRKFLVGLFHTWCIWGGLQLIGGILLMMRHVSLHPRTFEHSYSMSTSGFPLLTLRIGMGSHHPDQWDVSLFSVVLNILMLLLLGRVIAASSRIHPQTLLLAIIMFFVIANVGSIISSLVMIAHDQTGGMNFLIRDIVGLAIAPALILIGAGLSTRKTEREIGERGV